MSPRRGAPPHQRLRPSDKTRRRCRQPGGHADNDGEGRPRQRGFAGLAVVAWWDESALHIDPETGSPRFHRHRVSEVEVEDVLVQPLEDRVGAEGAHIAIGRTRGGRYSRVVCVPDPSPGPMFVITA